MRIINLEAGIHFTIGEADAIQLTMDGLRKDIERGQARQRRSNSPRRFRCVPLPADTSQRGSFAQAAGADQVMPPAPGLRWP